MDGRDLFFRFLFGGSAVVLSYEAAKLLPWKVIGGFSRHSQPLWSLP